jgi:hypothetical protein
MVEPEGIEPSSRPWTSIALASTAARYGTWDLTHEPRTKLGPIAPTFDKAVQVQSICRPCSEQEQA